MEKINLPKNQGIKKRKRVEYVKRKKGNLGML